MQYLFAAPPIARTPSLMGHRKNHERIGFPTVDERIWKSRDHQAPVRRTRGRASVREFLNERRGAADFSDE